MPLPNTTGVRKINYSEIKDIDIANGDGIRTTLFVSGCSLRCEGCFNPELWNLKSGRPFDQEAKEHLFEAAGKDFIDGITLLGGDPLEPNNRATVTAIAKEFKELYPEKTIWLWTGRLYEQVKDEEIMDYVDVLIDGPFVQSQSSFLLNYRGSKNQRVYRRLDGELKEVKDIDN